MRSYDDDHFQPGVWRGHRQYRSTPTSSPSPITVRMGDQDDEEDYDDDDHHDPASQVCGGGIDNIDHHHIIAIMSIIRMGNQDGENDDEDGQS